MLAFIFESIGVGEWVVLLAVLLVVVGPNRLPSTARKFGQYYAKFRRAAEGFKRQLLEMDTEIERTVREAEAEANKVVDEVASETSGSAASEADPYDPYSDDSFYGGEEYVEPDIPAATPDEPTKDDAASAAEIPPQASEPPKTEAESGK